MEVGNQFWENKEAILCSILSKSHSSKYDVIIPVRGDAEDYFVVEYVLKNALNPLVVFVNNYFLTSLGWKNLQNLITKFDVDSIIYNPNIKTYKELVSTSLRKVKSIYTPYKSLMHNYVMSLAQEKQIPFVLWGQCQPQELAGRFGTNDYLRLSKWWVDEHELSETLPNILGTGGHLETSDYANYLYPTALEYRGTQGLFLSNYLPWEQTTALERAMKYGFQPQTHAHSASDFENVGSNVYYQMHDLLRIECGHEPKFVDQLRQQYRLKQVSKIQLDRIVNNWSDYLAYDIKDFFLEFLQTTSSGYSWFVEKQLPSSKMLIRTQSMKKLNNCMQQEKNELNYVRYAKGIKL